MKTKTITVFLFLSGVTGIYIGFSLLFTPIEFEASAGIPVVNNVNLLSEIRSSGGILLAAGFIIALGAFRPEITRTALIISSLFYLGYGISRSVAILFDGAPDTSLIAVTLAELIIGAISLVLLRSHSYIIKK